MDGKEAAKFLERAKDLRALAETIRSNDHRKLLLDSAEKFENLAAQVLGAERQR
jgi:hypothetical protein